MKRPDAWNYDRRVCGEIDENLSFSVVNENALKMKINEYTQ